MIRYKRILSAYIGMHFIVDFSCAFLFFRFLYGSDNWLFCLLIYNFCAFALQMPIGLLADKWNKNALCAIGGCLLILISYQVVQYELITAVIAGIGNAMFHIGGGIDVLNMSKDKPTLLGLFVSPGAIGIFSGTLLGKGEGVGLWLPLILLLVGVIFIGVAAYADMGSFKSCNSEISFPKNLTSTLLISLGCLLAVVCLRSYIGMELRFPWKEIRIWGVLFVVAVVLGKICGGFLASKLGVWKTSFISLGLAALCFLFFDVPFLGLLAIFFFNMSMPITLWTVAKILPGAKGFSFGFLTFGLFIGFLPMYLNILILVPNRFIYAFFAVISMLLLVIGLGKGVRGNINE